jgi:hypothetical protein
MRLILHTLQKDVRRLWPVAAVTWVMLAALAREDRWRADRLASPLEGWMNPLLTLAWALLAALAVLEEPLVGERNFWTTRPYPWPALLASKLLFVALAIHLPSLVADVCVLVARGFSPVDGLGPLLTKQLLFFVAVTLPAIALATLVRNFTHFVIAVFAISAGVAILNGGFQSFPDFRHHESEVRNAAIRILLAAGALAVIWTQYARRRAIPARIMAIAAALAAASISAWLPARAEYAVIGSRSLQAPRISLRNSPSAEASALVARVGGGRLPVVLLPIGIEPGAPNDRFHMAILDVEIVTPDGARLPSVIPTPNRPFEKIDLIADSFSTSQAQGRSSSPGFYNPPDWLALRFSEPAWQRWKNARVRIHGAAAFDFYRKGETTVLPLQSSAAVPDVGRCTAMTVDDRYSEEMLKVLCESPRDLPAASIALRDQASGREWRLGLNSAATYSPGPHETWLSPLNRGESFFHLTDSVESLPRSQWLVPVSYLSSSRIEITPEIATGHALARFDLGEVTLASWLVRR